MSLRRLPLVVWLWVLWVGLWEDLSPGTGLAGLAVGLGVAWLLPDPPPGPSSSLRLWAGLRFLVVFLWKLAESSAVVAWEVVTPWSNVREGIVAVPVRGVSDTIVTLVANVISLTPGTLTLEVERDPTVLYIHVLHLRDVESVRADVQHLEALCIRAFGSPEAIDLLDRPLATEEH
ncbi:MAG: Na+/H+ antiporter subunit E [Acidimicrobiia bacterium]|nr:Na+/H+ antiporter subunit E [Acidimicrobiia bacterium]